jgi:FO synthase
MSARSIWAVVPVKPFAIAKRRLTPVLSSDERAQLARLMLEDVLDVLAACTILSGVVVITRDNAAGRIAQMSGACVMSDPVFDINAAVGVAIDLLRERRSAGMIVVPSDIPLLPLPLIEVLGDHISRPRAVALVPATRDGGTNLLACSPVDAISPSFGPNSFQRHFTAARGAGIMPTVLASEAAGLDIDRSEDLAAFLSIPSATRSRAFLAALDIEARLQRNSVRSHASRPIPQRVNEGMRTISSVDLDYDGNLSRQEALALVDCDLDPLLRAAGRRRDAAHGSIVSYSRKVFIPLTKLCRDVCHYCTFAHPPRKNGRAYLSLDEVLAIARAGQATGCKEALFTLGDQPEQRYRTAADELAHLGHRTTLSYLAEAARTVIKQTGLLPHLNPGHLTPSDVAALRTVSLSQGLMLESAAERLCERGGPHHGSPDKHPRARLASIRAAGEQHVPFTSGILIGIGETREERIDALLALRELNDAYGHIQEIIIQNFRPKPGTRMADAPAPSLDEHLWTIAIARLLFAPSMSIQAPPNLSPVALRRLIDAGINDWGGVSPVTPDHVNPEAPWPHLKVLERATHAAGKQLVERLAIYPAFARRADAWVDPALRTSLLHHVDADGWPRTDDWYPGTRAPLPGHAARKHHPPVATEIPAILRRAQTGKALGEADIVRLFRARGAEFAAVCAEADELRRAVNGDVISYVVTRNINYTNICYFKCQFCAFSKGKMSENLRGRPYDLSLEEIERRVREAWARGATEVCMQGGIHPSYTGAKYLDICRAVKGVAPDIHIHAFSPLEVHQGASTLGIPVDEFLRSLQATGLGTLPGTAAEILDDEVRAVLCPDKIRTSRWLKVMRAAHRAGLRSTATVMFGHVDRYEHWARHILRIRELQEETAGFTEFVPLPFVHMEAPIYVKGRSRRGPTFREAVLMHAVGRLALNPLITNIQTSWVKMGPEGVKTCLRSGANDLGGTLMDETITRSAGASHGQEMTPVQMEEIIRSLGRTPRQRNTLYDTAPQDRYRASFIDQRAASAT